MSLLALAAVLLVIGIVLDVVDEGPPQLLYLGAAIVFIVWLALAVTQRGRNRV